MLKSEAAQRGGRIGCGVLMSRLGKLRFESLPSVGAEAGHLTLERAHETHGAGGRVDLCIGHLGFFRSGRGGKCRGSRSIGWATKEACCLSRRHLERGR